MASEGSFRRAVGNKGNSEKIPVGPFVDWLETTYEKEQANGGAYAERVAVKLGLCPPSPSRKESDAAVRCLYRLRKAKVETRRDGKRVVFDATEYVRKDVQTMCDHVDGTLFEKLYPDVDAAGEELDPFADVTLEPDAWCPYCKQNVTPIDGLCPWCVCEHGHIFREVGFTESGFACLQCAQTGRYRTRESADRLTAPFEGDGVTDEMVSRLKAGEAPLPLQRRDGYEQAIRLRGKGLRWKDIAAVMESYHGVKRTPEIWGRIVRALEEAA